MSVRFVSQSGLYTPKERLADLSIEDRLAGIKIEELLKGMSPEQRTMLIGTVIKLGESGLAKLANGDE